MRSDNGLRWPLATVVLVLVLSLGGVSYATSLLPRNSVGAKQLKPRSVTSKQIRQRSVTLNKLSFPVGAAGVSANVNRLIVGGFCNGDVADPPPCVPLFPDESVKTSINVRRGGVLHITGTVGVAGLGRQDLPNGHADVEIGLRHNGDFMQEKWIETIGLDQSKVIPVDVTIPARPGRHDLNLVLGGRGEQLNVKATSATLSLQIMPKS